MIRNDIVTSLYLLTFVIIVTSSAWFKKNNNNGTLFCEKMQTNSNLYSLSTVNFHCRYPIKVEYSYYMACGLAGGSKWGHAPGGAGLGGASTHFIQRFKTFFSRILDLNVPNNAYFLKNKKKAVRSLQRRFAPEPTLTPMLLLWPTDVALSSSFPALNYFITSKK